MNEQAYTLWSQATLFRNHLIEISAHYNRKPQRERLARIIDRALDREARRWFRMVR